MRHTHTRAHTRARAHTHTHTRAHTHTRTHAHTHAHTRTHTHTHTRTRTHTHTRTHLRRNARRAAPTRGCSRSAAVRADTSANHGAATLCGPSTASSMRINTCRATASGTPTAAQTVASASRCSAASSSMRINSPAARLTRRPPPGPCCWSCRTSGSRDGEQSRCAPAPLCNNRRAASHARSHAGSDHREGYAHAKNKKNNA